MVHTGLDVWIGNSAPELQAMRLGLVSHPAAVLSDLTGAVDALRNAGYKLTALFGPEHGFGGAALDGAHISNTIDPHTGLPVFSLYGDTREPTAEMLADVDALVFDMQDVGVRFYTYLSTLFYVLRGAAKTGKPVYVLDRPNPITGSRVEGGPIMPGFESFVGIINIPIRHGMTLGELARYMNEENALDADLHVIEMQGWQRQMWFDETGLPWIPTSPAMPHLSTATLYPGMCFLEGTSLSPGRGSALPFEICGAPWIDGYALAEELNRLQLPGVCFRAITFTPALSTHAGTECYGVQVHVTDRNSLRPVEMALHLIAVARCLSGDAWAWNLHFDRLAGDSAVRSALDAGVRVDEIIASWEEAISTFIHQREKYLLY
ncbi:MAG TPA: DUF1343 domain-containing protein [Anaerolineales bacterium]|jgi:beta-N-acetylhexosaminidase|nr:DUF1343 domain-containing protein [Anaerolineales bacterium]